MRVAGDLEEHLARARRVVARDVEGGFALQARVREQRALRVHALAEQRTEARAVVHCGESAACGGQRTGLFVRELRTVHEVDEVPVDEVVVAPAEELRHGGAAVPDFACRGEDEHDGLVELGDEEVGPAFALCELEGLRLLLLCGRGRRQRRRLRGGLCDGHGGREGVAGQGLSCLKMRWNRFCQSECTIEMGSGLPNASRHATKWGSDNCIRDRRSNKKRDKNNYYAGRRPQ